MVSNISTLGLDPGNLFNEFAHVLCSLVYGSIGTGTLQFNSLQGGILYFPLVYLLAVKIKTEQLTDAVPAVLVQTLHVYPSVTIQLYVCG